MKRVCWIAALALLKMPVDLRAENDLSKEQVAAYIAVVKADLARDNGAIAEARKRYQEALDLYTAIAKTDPKWHPDIVQFRIAYCRSQLEALRGREEGERPPTAAQASPGAPDPATAEALKRLKQLDAEIADLRAQLDAARQERDALAAERDACREAYAAAEAEKKELTTKLEDALSLLNAANLGDPLQELAPLREALDAAAREIDAARSAALQRLQNAAPTR
jgi:FtsZ-binding cell division protein ZapB